MTYNKTGLTYRKWRRIQNFVISFLKEFTYLITCLFFVASRHLVWAIGLHLDGTSEIGRQLFITSSPERETCGRLFDHFACGHHHGFPQWILCTSAVAGLLCGASKSNGIGHNDAYDIAGADMGSACHLYSGKWVKIFQTVTWFGVSYIHTYKILING